MSDDPTFGHVLRSGLITTGETQQALADAIGVSQRQVQGWVCGERLPMADHLVAVCRHFGWVSGRVLEVVARDTARRRERGPL